MKVTTGIEEKVLVLTLCKFFTAREERIGFTDLVKGFK